MSLLWYRHLMLKFFKPVVAKVIALLEQQVRHAQSAGGSKAINVRMNTNKTPSQHN